MTGYVTKIAENSVLSSWLTMWRGYQTVHIEVFEEQNKKLLYPELDNFKLQLAKNEILFEIRKPSKSRIDAGFYTIDFKNDKSCSLQVMNKVLDICQKTFPEAFEKDKLKSMFD